jgi:hypothetical protein
MNIITRNMNLTEKFLPQINNFIIIQDESGNYIGFTGLLMKDEADIPLGGILKTSASATLMDVTTIYWPTKWEWYVPCPVKLPGWKSIFRIFSLSGWLSIILAEMLANLVIVFLVRFGIKEHESFWRVTDAILDVWALILGVSISSLRRTTPYDCSSQPGCATAWQSTQCSRLTSLRFWWILSSRNQLQT